MELRDSTPRGLAMSPEIVVLDDNEGIANWIQDYFTRKGYKVFSAFNALDALSLVNRKTKLLITDYAMRGLTGADLAMMVKLKYNVPILGMSGEFFDTLVLRSSFDDFIQKPFHGAVLLARAEILMRRPPYFSTS